MSGTATRWMLSIAGGLVALGLLAPRASAFDFFDGRVQVHGFYEAQLRTLARDFDAVDDFDLTQWWNIINIEIEMDIAPDGFGPFDLVSAFARIEVRYDCVYTRACGIFPGADTYGEAPKKLPKRLADGRRTGFTGTQFIGDTSHYLITEPALHGYPLRDFPPEENRKAGRIRHTPTLGFFFGGDGPDALPGTADDPAPFYFSRLVRGGDHCYFMVAKRKGSADGVGNREMGPIDPSCKVIAIGPMADKPNPFRAGDFNPVTGAGGAFALPFRPAPVHSNTSKVSIARGEAKGTWIPNYGLQQILKEGRLDNIQQNFRLEELAWNRGASQQTEKELKEFYIDLELFDSRLFLRIGRQTIVWGKTELFAIDPWNPNDIALGSLTSLEESRIAQWMVRAIWSFYEVGPLDDVRLEMVANFNKFTPNDFGRCGEPYTPLPACALTFGTMIHGYTGLGLAGFEKPPHPWNSWKGIEVGARVEWRWDRFSFALSDYYGYTDSPYTDQIFKYSRNVDPKTGRPRHTTTTGGCQTGREASCLQGDEALEAQHGNQQLFAMICATSIGFSSLDFAACAQSVFNSLVPALPGNPLSPTVGLALTNVLAGDGSNVILAGLIPGFNANTIASVNSHLASNAITSPGGGNPLVPLSIDVNDGVRIGFPAVPGVVVAPPFLPPGIFFGGFTVFGTTGLMNHLTDEQEALLGCGAFYETLCDFHGIDLFNAEFSAIAQSWVTLEGTFGTKWDTTDGSLTQPGTVGFQGGPACTRYADGKVWILPGCRGPGDEGYDPKVDGTTTAAGFTVGAGQRVQPFTGQPFRSEMAVVSWNAMMALVAFSFADSDGATATQFDPEDPFRLNACSFASPQYCGVLSAFTAVGVVQRNTLNAGGNGRFGRRDFVWHMGTPLVGRFEKRNILGFGLDFAEDVTKTNWGFEFNWEEGLKFSDADAMDGLSETDTINLTVSVDRPTFINFLNPGRTFFINSQWFFSYVTNYQESFQGSGPINILGTLSVFTGYFQDRLLPGFTLVYDFRSNSGALLPNVTYRFTESFSANFGIAAFWGREVAKKMHVMPVATGNRVGRHAYKNLTEPGLSLVRERDELYLRVKYTF